MATRRDTVCTRRHAHAAHVNTPTRRLCACSHSRPRNTLTHGCAHTQTQNINTHCLRDAGKHPGHPRAHTYETHKLSAHAPMTACTQGSKRGHASPHTHVQTHTPTVLSSEECSGGHRCLKMHTHTHTHTHTRMRSRPQLLPHTQHTHDVTQPVDHTGVPSHIRRTVPCGGWCYLQEGLVSTGTVRDRLPLGPAGTLGFGLDLTRSMHGVASQQRRAHFQEQGNLEKLSKRCEYGGARSQGATRAPLGSTLDPPGPPALKNKTSPGELHLFPSSARSCLGRVGFSPQAQPCCARPPSSPSRPPMESNRMGAGGSHQADFLLAISCAPDRSRHMDPTGSVTCLWPFPLSLQHWAGYSLAPPLLILVPVSVPCRQSTT